MSRMKLLASASVIASLSIMVSIGGALAQDATPTVDRSPNPDECVVAGKRTVVVLADPSTALAGLPQDPTQDQINEQISGAAVEVLVGTQSPTSPSSPQPTAS